MRDRRGGNAILFKQRQRSDPRGVATHAGVMQDYRAQSRFYREVPAIAACMRSADDNESAGATRQFGKCWGKYMIHIGKYSILGSTMEIKIYFYVPKIA